MLSDEQKTQSLLAPCLPLSFLLELHPRETNRKNAPGISDSAIFFRLWDLFDTLREPEVIATLTPEQRVAADRFHAIMERLPWQPLSAHPHVKELPEDNLSPLIEAGRLLYTALAGKPPR